MTMPPPPAPKPAAAPASFTSKHLIGFIAGAGVLLLLVIVGYFAIRIPPTIPPAESSFVQ